MWLSPFGKRMVPRDRNPRHLFRPHLYFCAFVFTPPRPEDAKHFAANMLGHKLITKQTGEDGLPCDKVRNVGGIV